MRAAVLRELAQPLEIVERERPEPGAGEVLIEVAACGVCHSDLHVASGEWDLLRPITRLPLVPGHEVTGTVVALGPGVEEVVVGDRVGVPWLHYTCGECEFCLAGRETLCVRQKITGVTVDGGYAEYLKAPASHVAKLPDNLGFVEAAPMLCAALTVFNAFRRSGVRSGERMAIFGIGGLGHLAIQLATEQGIEVIAVDVSAEKLELARQCGATHLVSAASPTAAKEIRKIGGGAHVAMVTAGSRQAYETALRSLRRGGTLTIVGMAPEPFDLSTVAMVSGEYRIVAAAVGTREELREVLRLAGEGRLRCHTEVHPLDEINDLFERMRAGAINGRAVLRIR